MQVTVGFHEGELDVQRRAGVERQATRLAGMLDRASLDGGAGRFLAQRDLAMITARDRDGRLWTSPLRGTAGFLDGHGTTLDVHEGLDPADPLAGMPADQPVGLLVIDFPLRRRVRVNGLLTAAGDTGLAVEVDQAYGNCPQHITPHPSAVTVETADTFFLGTVHPTRGADTSHKGGPAGFVHRAGDELWWPDFPGNNMFNSLGNVAVNPEASLLFADVTHTLHLSGTAAVEWAGTDRLVRFRAERELMRTSDQ